MLHVISKDIFMDLLSFCLTLSPPLGVEWELHSAHRPPGAQHCTEWAEEKQRHQQLQRQPHLDTKNNTPLPHTLHRTAPHNTTTEPIALSWTLSTGPALIQEHKLFPAHAVSMQQQQQRPASMEAPVTPSSTLSPSPPVAGVVVGMGGRVGLGVGLG